MKILGVVGARPDFVKIAPPVRAMGRHPTIISVLVSCSGWRRSVTHGTNRVIGVAPRRIADEGPERILDVPQKVASETGGRHGT